MTRRIDAVPPVEGRDRRAAERRLAERRAELASAALAPAEAPETVETPAKPAVEADPGAAVFAAQLMGQSGQRRGLKGGPPVLEAARSTYLGAEYSGPAERRPKLGKARDTDA